MEYVVEEKRKTYLLLGFIGMFLCGIGDILLAFRGEGTEKILGGIITQDIVNVPLWYYLLSFFIGILAMIGYFLGSKAMYSYIKDRLQKHQSSKLLKTFVIGANMMSLGIFGIHSVCSIALMALRSAVAAGVSAEVINETFMVPMLLPFIVTTIWQTVADILVAVAYIGLILNNVIEVSKKWIIIGPISLYVIFGILRTIIVNAFNAELLGKFLAGGETWGLSFMFLSLYLCLKNKDKKLKRS